jgi:hypothetical protein
VDSLYSFFEESDASVPHSSTVQGIGSEGAVPSHVEEHVQQEDVITRDQKISQCMSVVSFTDVTCHITSDD